MNSLDGLRGRLHGINTLDYCSYQSLVGKYEYEKFDLHIDKIPQDPYAPAYTGVYRIRIPLTDTNISEDMITPTIRRIALSDYLTRQFSINCSSISKTGRGTGNSGLITILKPGQAVLARSSIMITRDYLEVRFFIGLPAKQRKIDSKTAEIMLFNEVPEIVDKSLFIDNLDMEAIYKHLEVTEDAEYLRNYLKSRDLLGFISDGSLLPRRSGIDDRPLSKKEAVIFNSPDSMREEVTLPNNGKIRGMAIKEGITIIVGGGYHGKSTLLNALELGIYNHIPGDGREFCVATEETVKIRASSGRCITNVDISMFLNNMPLKIDTESFSTENASGSTSQAASIIESIEAGAKILLMDEDTCAANFMIRDKRMQELIPKADEPITSFIDCIRYLYDTLGISTILVMGGSGDYFDLADNVIQMKDFLPFDVTQKAYDVAKNCPTNRNEELTNSIYKTSNRLLIGEDISPYNEYNKLRISAPNDKQLIFGKNKVDVSDLEQLVELSQIKAIGVAINMLLEHMDGRYTMQEIMQKMMFEIETKGIDVLDMEHRGDLSTFRGIELAATINRMRTLKVIK